MLLKCPLLNVIGIVLFLPFYFSSSIHSCIHYRHYMQEWKSTTSKVHYSYYT